MSARRPLLLPLTPLFSLASGLKNFCYDNGLLRPRRLNRPVISVGSLSAGGAGKTPIVLMLADLLTHHGVTSDVLSRGYGRTATAVEQVDPSGPPSRFGDEPVELARAGLSVFVGAERYDAGILAESQLTSQVHLLDDGFQHRRLARHLDIVLLTSAELRDQPLPAGNLRESIKSLSRAQVIIVREEENTGLLQFLLFYNTSADIWVVRRTLTLPASCPARNFAFCGIARPESFSAMLENAGANVCGNCSFPDHHPYSELEIAQLVDLARRSNANGFITTAKDVVKLSPEFLLRLEAIGPVVVARLRVELLDEPAAWSRLSKVLTHE